MPININAVIISKLIVSAVDLWYKKEYLIS